MQLFRIAVATRCFGQPLKEAVGTAASLGATGVQFDVRNELKPTDLTATGRRQFLHFLSERGLTVASLELPVRHAFYDEEYLEARIAAAKSALEFAFQLKASVVTTRLGRIPEDPASPESQVLREVLNELARHGNRVGAVLAITPSRDNPEALLRVMNEVTEGPIGINFDPAVFVMSGRKPTPILRDLHRHIMHMVARDAVSEQDGGGREVPLGRGEVEWDEFIAQIAEMDYRGWVTVDRTQGDDRLRDVSRAVQYLRNVAMGS